MEINWNRTHEFGDHDTVGRLTDGRWFWTWNTGPGKDPETLLEMGSEDGEDGGQVFDSYEELIDGLEGRDELAALVRKRFGHLSGTFHLNMWVDSELWRQLSIRAAELGIKKREAVETALREWLKK